MARWITNWPAAGGKWASCSPAMAAQIAADPGGCLVALVDDDAPLTRHILHSPAWSLPARGNRAVALALRLSPLDRFRAIQAA